ncbi:MAG: flagellar biosynthesis protein [Alphaproteobacteria bacterium]|nr:flagellar biosynthesis protein [Alphaproteobacteria bacterium]
MNRTVAVLAVAGALVTGCALDRSVIDVSNGSIPPNPAGPAAVAVKIVEVKDQRPFHIDPPRPDMPSLMNDEEIKNKAITGRAIGRKRNTYGAALGDVLLPEGRNVTQLTTEALTSALRQAGYRVLASGEPGYADAVPLTATVHQFWAYFSPGFWQITLRYDAKVTLVGDWPLAGDRREITTTVQQQGMAATEDAWASVVNTGLAQFVSDVKGALRTAAVRISRLFD